MATRSGSVDPGLLFYLLRHGLWVDELDHGLEQESGLLGLSGCSPDVRELEAMAASDERARLALTIYVRVLWVLEDAYRPRQRPALPGSYSRAAVRRLVAALRQST